MQKVKNDMQNYLTKQNIIIGAVVLALIIGALVYFGLRTGENGEADSGGFFGLFPGSSDNGGRGIPPPPAPTPPAPESVAPPTPSVSNLPISAEEAKKLPVGSLIQLTAEAVASLKPHAEGVVQYHKNVPENLGHMFARKADGTSPENRYSNFTIPQILKVVWSPAITGNSRAVIFYNLNGQIRKLLIEYTSLETKTNFLPDTISDVAFSPDGKSMAFINDLDVTRNLFVATSDFKNPKKLLDNNIARLELSWPSANVISLKTPSSYLATGFLYSVDAKTGALAKIAEGLGLDAIWNSDGTGAIYSTTNAGGGIGELKFYDIKSDKTMNLGVRTIAEKCAFLKTKESKNMAYCAVPKNAFTEFKYPDDWWKGKISFSDDFVLIDTAQGTALPFITTTMDIINPNGFADDSWMVFRNKNDGALWSIKLK